MGAIGLFLSKYWKQVLIVALIIFVLVYIWYQGKKSGEAGKPKQTDIPIDIFGSSGNVLVDGGKVRRIATELHNDMDGFNIGHDDEIYTEFSTLSDSETTAVYNDFNERYFSEGEGTLTEWIQAEYFMGTVGFSWTIIDDVILPKLLRLNLN